LLSIIRKRRAFAKAVMWILVVMISIGLLAWYGAGSVPQASPPPQVHQQDTP